MSEPTNEQRLWDCLTDMLNELDRFSLTDATKARAREVLKATEPKHPAVVAWEEWAGAENLVGGSEANPGRKTCFLAGYKAGMSGAADMVNAELCRRAGLDDSHQCELTKRIRDAVAKVPQA